MFYVRFDSSISAYLYTEEEWWQTKKKLVLFQYKLKWLQIIEIQSVIGFEVILNITAKSD